MSAAASQVGSEAVQHGAGGGQTFPFVPRIRIYTERIAVDRGAFLRPDLEDETRAVLSLTFDYGGGASFRATPPEPSYSIPPGDEFDFDSVDAAPAPMTDVNRDLRAEARAQCLLETFGAVEIAPLDDFIPGADSKADYLVHIDDDVHAVCSFVAHAVPSLRARGFVIDVDPEFPYRVGPVDAPWYAKLDVEGADWFSLELGVEVDGQRVNLLPALLDLLESVPDDSSLRALRRLPAKYRVVRIGKNQYLPFPPERLLALLQILVDLYDGTPSSEIRPVFRKERALCLVGLDEAVGGREPVRFTRGAERVKKARALALRPEPDEVEVAEGLQATLRPYQLEGLSCLQHWRRNDVGGILADDMGLGKTLQTIAHFAREKECGRMDRPSLIVMPTSLVGNWAREIQKFAPFLRTTVVHGPRRQKRSEPLDAFDIVLTTYPVLIRDVETLKKTSYHLLVLDEAQAVKNPRSRAHQAIAELESRHRLCLTGTPVENNLDELRALFEILAPGLLGSAEEFRARFRHPIEKEGNEQQLALLRQRVAPYVLRRTKEQVAKDLPPKTEIVRPVQIEGAERELYESIRVAAHAEVRKLIRKKGLVASTVAILDALMKLRQACCHPRLVAMEQAKSVVEAAKFDTLFMMLTEQLAAGRRILVFSQFARMLALISEELLKRGVRHAMLTGATRDRQAAIDGFQNGKVDLFLISLKAGGTGLNLTRADTVIHYEPWWNPAAQAQATDRAYRIGQTSPVFVYSLVVSGSVEEQMLRLQEQKRALADSILGTGGPVAHFSEEDVDTLFAPIGED